MHFADIGRTSSEYRFTIIPGGPEVIRLHACTHRPNEYENGAISMNGNNRCCMCIELCDDVGQLQGATFSLLLEKVLSSTENLLPGETRELRDLKSIKVADGGKEEGWRPFFWVSKIRSSITVSWLQCSPFVFSLSPARQTLHWAGLTGRGRETDTPKQTNLDRSPLYYAKMISKTEGQICHIVRTIFTISKFCSYK